MGFGGHNVCLAFRRVPGGQPQAHQSLSRPIQ
jgi:hypothetical protein